MMTAFAGMSESAVKLVGLAVTIPGNRGRNRDGEVAVRGNSNLRLGTQAPFCSGSLRYQPTGLPCAEIREILRLKHECVLPNAQIAAALGIAKGSVANYLAAAATAGLTHSEALTLDDAALNARLHPRRYVFAASCARRR